MTYGRKYIVAQKIKMHTKPLKMLYFERTGTFIKCTKHFYVFKEFRARKNTTFMIMEVHENDYNDYQRD